MIAKRLFDFLTALLLLILFLPIIFVLSIIIWIKLGRPILFKQRRPGLHGRPFVIYKFRSMEDIYDSNGKLLPDEARLTKFGQFLRRSSLDELPELLNVFKGEMSFVGPRPLLMEYLPLYSKEQARRHEVRPGITGWAQVNGRNAIDWTKKLNLDVWYVNNRSFVLDLKILYLTPLKILKNGDVDTKEGRTMPYFQGQRE